MQNNNLNRHSRLPRQLSPWNPLDHLRLLWWTLVVPQHLKSYRQVYGNEDEHRVGRWLVSKLTWIPILIPVFAIESGVPIGAKPIHLPTRPFFVSMILIFAWVLTGWFSKRGWCLAIGVIVRMTFGISIGAIVGIAVAMMIGTVPGVVIGVTISIAVITAFEVATGMMMNAKSPIKSSVGNYRSHSLSTTDLAEIAIEMAAFGCALTVIDLATGVIGKVKMSLITGRPYWPARWIFVVILLAYAFVVWFTFLQGWQALAQ